MEYKLLNFPEAMRLAQIISKYVDTAKIKEMTGEEFAYTVFSEMSTDEIVEVSGLLLKNIKEGDDPHDIIFQATSSMIKNNILQLLGEYDRIGFGK